MLCRNVVDELLDQHGLAHARAAEQADFSALCIRREQVNHLDTGFQHFHDRTLLLKMRRLPVDDPVRFLVKRLTAVNRLTQHIKQPSQCLFSYWNLYSLACSCYFHVPAKSLACRQHDAAHGIVANMLCYLHHKAFSLAGNF